MVVPKSVKIFGQRFKVKVVPLHGYLGLCDRATNTLYVESNQSEKEIYQTLLHEIGHAVVGRTGIAQALSPEVEEIIVENIATAIIENFEFIPKIK